jgi:hypothetical protein
MIKVYVGLKKEIFRLNFDKFSKILSSSRLVLVILLIFIFIGCTSCTDDEQYTHLQNQNAALEQKLKQASSLSDKLTAEKKNLTTRIYSMAELYNSIAAYEEFLKTNSGLTDLEKQAVNRIYELTRQADLIEGYQYFLGKYPKSLEAREANHRLYEITYLSAKKENTIPAYYSYLSVFKAAPSDLRNAALSNAISLECQSLDKEYQMAVQDRQNDEVFRSFMVDKIGRRIYEEAINNKEKGDEVAFLQNYNAVQKCNLFRGSNTRFGLLRDAELKKVLERIEDQIKQIREDLTQSNKLILDQLDEIKGDVRQQTDYIRSLNVMLKEQGHILADMNQPLGWNESESPWENFMRIGPNALGVLQTAASFLPMIPIK